MPFILQTIQSSILLRSTRLHFTAGDRSNVKPNLLASKLFSSLWHCGLNMNLGLIVFHNVVKIHNLNIAPPRENRMFPIPGLPEKFLTISIVILPSFTKMNASTEKRYC